MITLVLKLSFYNHLSILMYINKVFIAGRGMDNITKDDFDLIQRFLSKLQKLMDNLTVVYEID